MPNERSSIPHLLLQKYKPWISFNLHLLIHLKKQNKTCLTTYLKETVQIVSKKKKRKKAHLKIMTYGKNPILHINHISHKNLNECHFHSVESNCCLNSWPYIDDDRILICTERQISSYLKIVMWLKYCIFKASFKKTPLYCCCPNIFKGAESHFMAHATVSSYLQNRTLTQLSIYLSSYCSILFFWWGRFKYPLLLLWRKGGIQWNDFYVTNFRT